MPTGQRYRMLLASKKVYKGSFVPKAMSTLNNKMLWCISVAVSKLIYAYVWMRADNYQYFYYKVIDWFVTW